MTPQIGRPSNPDDPDGERTFMMDVPTADLMPYVDLRGGVQLADREGVFAHSFRCRRCRLHFVLFSWAAERHRPETIACPECRSSGAFLHMVTQLSASTDFDVAPDRQPEIYDVWPFRIPTDRG